MSLGVSTEIVSIGDWMYDVGMDLKSLMLQRVHIRTADPKESNLIMQI